MVGLGEPHDVYPVDTARLRRVTELVAEKAGWGKKLPPGHGLGIAAHRSFVSNIATVVEVAVDNKGNLTVPHVDTAIDCGSMSIPSASARRSRARRSWACRSPNMARSRSRTDASSRATSTTIRSSATKIADGDQYAHRREQHRCAVSGVGEPGLPPFAPALCNAIFAATGKRIRRLPIGNQLA